MTSPVELAKEVVIICVMLANNNYNKPVVNVDKIISCTNIYNEELVVNKRRNPYTDNLNNNSDSRDVYVINDSNITIDN